MSGYPGKRYLGDAVYIEYDATTDMLTLTTEDGIRATNTIYLDREVAGRFRQFLADLVAAERPEK